MSRYQRKMARAAQQQAAAARAVAAQNAQVAAAQAQWFRTQAVIAASEAEARRVAGLPVTCAHCRQVNPPGALECRHCGGGAFLPPPPPPGWRPAPPPAGSAWSRAWRAYRRLDGWLQVAVAAVAVAIVAALVTVGATTKATTATASGALPPGPVTVIISGTGPAASVSISDGEAQRTWDHVPLPATYHVAQPDAAGIEVTATTGGGYSGQLSCSLSLGDGTPPVTYQASGSFATATCDSLGS
jgi:ribosomal protein L40E